MITSAQNPKVKLVRGLLASKKNREKNGQYVLEGVRLAEEVLSAGFRPEFAMFSHQLSERGTEIIESLRTNGVDIEEIDSDLLNRISDTQSSQGILLVLPLPDQGLDRKYDFVLVLDQIRDPGNFGTLLRTAAALGFHSIILTPESIDPYSPKVIRAAMGAQLKINVRIMDALKIRDFCNSDQSPGLRIFLSDASSGRKCWDAEFKQPVCLVIGGEAEGATPEMREIADEIIRIPMESGTESVNAAVAGSILMYEIYRQRKTP